MKDLLLALGGLVVGLVERALNAPRPAPLKSNAAETAKEEWDRVRKRLAN